MGASPQGGKLAGRKASMSALAKRAVIDSFAKLTPREQAKNPVMLMVYISAILTLGLFALSLFGIADAHPAFIFAVSAVLWLTVLFANFANRPSVRIAAKLKPTRCAPRSATSMPTS